METKLFEANKMLSCDCLDNLIVSLMTVPGSHECPEYHTVHYCAQTAQLFCKKIYFWQVRQVLSPIVGQVVTYFVNDSLSYHL